MKIFFLTINWNFFNNELKTNQTSFHNFPKKTIKRKYEAGSYCSMKRAFLKKLAENFGMAYLEDNQISKLDFLWINNLDFFHNVMVGILKRKKLTRVSLLCRGRQNSLFPIFKFKWRVFCSKMFQLLKKKRKRIRLTFWS